VRPAKKELFPSFFRFCRFFRLWWHAGQWGILIEWQKKGVVLARNYSGGQGDLDSGIIYEGCTLMLAGFVDDNAVDPRRPEIFV